MRKLILASLALVLVSAVLGGCKVGGEVDPDGNVSYNGAAAR